MSDELREGHYLLGIEGLALLRAGAGRRLGRVGERVRDIEQIVAALDEPLYAQRRDLPETGAEAGYAEWAASYDDPGNDTVELEEAIVQPLLDALPPGPVLDAACGTGRHAAYLAEAGRHVVGVDSSEEMLARARLRLPDADLRQGDLAELPLEDASVAAAVCALALSHLPQIGPAIAELGRVLEPGGRLVLSNPHPLATGVLGWRAVFTNSIGTRSMIPEYAHPHSEYVAALVDAGLAIRCCIEPPLTRAQARARAKSSHHDAFEDALTGLPAVLVWEAERTRA